MKTILAIVFALIAFPAHAIIVTGEANSFEAAKHQAFKKAIDYEVGVIVDTERVTYDRELLKNQILTYSAGYILDYKVISQSKTNGVYTIELDVTVASSKLKNFLLSHAKYEGKFLGENLKMQIDYYQKGLIDGDKLVINTLKYFPSEAININMDGYAVKIDENRNFYLEIPYVITWDKEYLTALKELLSLVNSPDWQKNRVQFDNEVFYFYDRVFMQHLYNRMTRTDFVQITMTNIRNDMLINSCVRNILYDPEINVWNARLSMYARRDNGITIYENKTVHNYIVVPIDREIQESLNDTTQIQLRIASIKDCP